MPTPAQIAAAAKLAEAAAKKLADVVKAKNALEKVASNAKTTESKAVAIREFKDAQVAAENALAAKKLADTKVANLETKARTAADTRAVAERAAATTVVKKPATPVVSTKAPTGVPILPSTPVGSSLAQFNVSNKTPAVMTNNSASPALAQFNVSQNAPKQAVAGATAGVGMNNNNPPGETPPPPPPPPADEPPVDDTPPADNGTGAIGGTTGGGDTGGGDTPPENNRPVEDIPSTDVPTTDVKQADSSAFGDDTRTLAFDTFKNTLALFFGREEIDNGGWAQGIYKSVSSFYKTGSTITESLNLSLQDVENNPDLKSFRKRFSGIYALQKRLVAGEAIDVPTIAEYFKAESDMGNILRDAGMGDLATQDFLGGILGKGKSVLEVSNLISGAFSAIDNAPKALKDTLQQYYPGADRASIAKAMLLGKDGAAELEKKIKGISVLSAAGSQGVNTDLGTASDIAARGYNYQDALTGFGQVKELERANALAGMEGGTFTQGQAQKYVFEQDVEQKKKLAAIKEKEESRFAGSSGTSKATFSTGYLNKQASGGNF